jgi:small subunit ribosomal protein S9
MAPTAPKISYTFGTGRRKTAVARVRVRDGSGRFLINRRDMDKYFPLIPEQNRILAPLRVVDAEKKFDIFVTCNGGGIAAQAGAISLGIARALLKINQEYEPVLRENKFLTRDSRQKERKKYGRRGARRGFQFSKR